MLAASSSCTSSKVYDAVGHSFKSRISKSGLKHFELRLKIPKQQLPLQDNKRQRPRKGRAKNQFEKIEKILQKSADLAIEKNQYCQEGYWVLDLDIDLRGPYIRGECNDLATEADKQNFPETLKQW
jgi:hypothetical protein